MANNYCDYSCLFPLKEEDKEKAFIVCEKIHDTIFDGDGHTTSWEWSGTGLWFNSDNGYGAPEVVVDMVKALLLEFTYVDGFHFSWSYTCSKLRIDEFGGGAWAGRVVDGVIEEKWIDACNEALDWLKEEPEMSIHYIRKIRMED